MPKLWAVTIEQHRRVLRDAVLDAMPQLIAAKGVGSVSMSDVAHAAGISRATLYKYFPDLDSLLNSWHERQVARHVEQLAVSSDAAADSAEALRAFILQYARMRSEHPEGETVARLHSAGHVGAAAQQLHAILVELLAAGASGGSVRADVSTDELAAFVLGATSAAAELRAPGAADRLTRLVLAALRPGATLGDRVPGEEPRPVRTTAIRD